MKSVDDSAEYYRLRETQERDAADKAATDAVRQIHTALADKYKELAENAKKRER